MYSSHGGCPLAGRPSMWSQKFMWTSRVMLSGNGSRNDGHSSGGRYDRWFGVGEREAVALTAEHREGVVPGVAPRCARVRAELGDRAPAP